MLQTDFQVSSTLAADIRAVRFWYASKPLAGKPGSRVKNADVSVAFWARGRKPTVTMHHSQVVKASEFAGSIIRNVTSFASIKQAPTGEVTPGEGLMISLNYPLNSVLQGFASDKLGNSLCLDFNFFTRLWISALSGLPLVHLEGAKANQRNRIFFS
jgi:hypothetical protein